MSHQGGRAPHKGTAQRKAMDRSRSANHEECAPASEHPHGTDWTAPDYLWRVFAQSTVGFYRTTPSGRILTANPALVYMLSQEQLRRLAERLQAVRENERKQLDREFHDNLGQRLAGLNVDLARLKSQLQSPRVVSGERGPVMERIDRMKQAIRDGLEDVQRIAAGLRPPGLDDLELLAALQWAAKKLRDRTGIRCRVECVSEEPLVSPDCAIDLFRICQEALTNVMRHTQARSVAISLRTEGQELILDISDDGRGIAEDEAAGPRSIGLLGIRERASSWGGQADISGSRGEGTRLSVAVPLDEVQRRDNRDPSTRGRRPSRGAPRIEGDH